MKVCCTNGRTLALVAMAGAAWPAHPHPGCLPALGGLQLRGHLVLAELPHGKSSQCLVRPGDSGASGGGLGTGRHSGLSSLSPRGREERCESP